MRGGVAGIVWRMKKDSTNEAPALEKDALKEGQH